MSGNLFGKLFQVMTFGESHGPAIGAVVDGMVAGIEISEEKLQLTIYSSGAILCVCISIIRIRRELYEQMF